MADQAERLRQRSKDNSEQVNHGMEKPEHVARVITVTSGKGGVGKTNFTVNLALALRNLGQKVLIIDADLGMANVDVILGCSTPYNIMHLLNGERSIDEVVATGPKDIKFLAGGSGFKQLANLNDLQLQEIINKIVQFDYMVDVILFDTGAGLNRNVMNFVIAADEVIIITTPEPPAITDAYAMMKAYSSSGGNAPLRLVVNRVSDYAEGQVVADKLSKVAFRFLNLQIKNLGYIEDDYNMVKAVKKQSPLMIAYPDTACAKSIEQIAYRLLYGETLANPSGIKGFFHRFFKML